MGQWIFWALSREHAKSEWVRGLEKDLKKSWSKPYNLMDTPWIKIAKVKHSTILSFKRRCLLWTYWSRGNLDGERGRAAQTQRSAGSPDPVFTLPLTSIPLKEAGEATEDGVQRETTMKGFIISPPPHTRNPGTLRLQRPTSPPCPTWHYLEPTRAWGVWEHHSSAPGSWDRNSHVLVFIV